MIFLLIWTPVQLQKPNVESITNQPTDTIEDSSPTAKVLKQGMGQEFRSVGAVCSMKESSGPQIQRVHIVLKA